jgi:hypothetical protein
VYEVVVAVTADIGLNSLFVVGSDIGSCDDRVENEWLLMLVKEFVDNVVSGMIVENVDGYIEVLTVVIG